MKQKYRSAKFEKMRFLSKWMNRREIFVSMWKDRNETLCRSEKIEMKLWVEVKWSKLTFCSMWISRSEKSIEVNRSKVKRIEEICIEVKGSNWLLYRSESIEHDIESKCMNRRWLSVKLQESTCNRYSTNSITQLMF